MTKSAIILCGGKGTRLGVLGKKTAKSMVKILNKEILWYIIQVLKKEGFKNIILPLGYKANQITKFLKKNKNFGINIKSVLTGLNTKIGKRLALAVKEIKDENFLLLNGDAIFDFNINDVIKEHKRKNSVVTFMSTEMTYQFGTVGVVNDKVLDFKRDLLYESLKVRGKRKYTAYNYSGMSLINTHEFLKLKKNCLKADNFEMEIYPKLIKKNAMMKNIVGFWHSIDNLKDIEVLKRNTKKINYVKRLKSIKNEK
jgi:glucose-1-phosphate cytidylyltransferase